jgi:hypothetical protein
MDRIGSAPSPLGPQHPGPCFSSRPVTVHLLAPADPGQFHGRAPGLGSSPVRAGDVWRKRLRIDTGERIIDLVRLG